MEQKLRNEAKALLEEGKVDYIVGFESGSLKFTTTPLITKDKNDVGRLVVNPFIANNLAKFLTELKGRVGIVAKGCDSRSIVSLIQDNKVARANVVILGVPCEGIIDLSKVEKLAGRDRDEIGEISRQGDKVSVTVDGQKSAFPISDVVFDKCLSCELPTPKECDVLLGEPASPIGQKAAGQADIERLKGKTPQERWEVWKKEFSRCIRCYACRNVCPACFCQRCFVEETEPKWVEPTANWQDNLLFQAVRNIHVAGRCTDCSECERACPMNIPLSLVNRKLEKEGADLFDYQAGTDPDAKAPLATFKKDESLGIGQ